MLTLRKKSAGFYLTDIKFDTASSHQNRTMHPLRRYRRWTSWMASLAILVAALAPALSHALGGWPGAGWVEVCSSQGARWVQADQVPQDSAPAGLQAGDACLYCSVHAPALGLPSLPAWMPLSSRLSQALPPAARATHVNSPAWLSAQPRAPPHLS